MDTAFSGLTAGTTYYVTYGTGQSMGTTTTFTGIIRAK